MPERRSHDRGVRLTTGTVQTATQTGRRHPADYVRSTEAGDREREVEQRLATVRALLAERGPGLEARLDAIRQREWRLQRGMES